MNTKRFVMLFYDVQNRRVRARFHAIYETAITSRSFAFLAVPLAYVPVHIESVLYVATTTRCCVSPTCIHIDACVHVRHWTQPTLLCFHLKLVRRRWPLTRPAVCCSQKTVHLAQNKVPKWPVKGVPVAEKIRKPNLFGLEALHLGSTVADVWHK